MGVIIERFSQHVINSGIFRVYIATGFFATLIFFVVNAHLFTPIEMVLWIVAVTIMLKTISNMMLSLIILLFSFDNKQAQIDFEYHNEKIDSLLGEISVKEASVRNSKK